MLWLSKAIGLLFLPPASFLILGFAGLWAMRRSPRLGTGLIVFSLFSGYALSTPIVGRQLVTWIEPAPGLPVEDVRGQAIVVLGGGLYLEAPEYGGDTLNAATLLRTRYGARLHRQTGKPLLVSGGRVESRNTSEADAMRAVLVNEWGIPDVWTETSSRTTLENARMSSALLRTRGIKTIYLVTDAWHMPRARWCFEQSGVVVISAPTGYTRGARGDLRDYLPSAHGLEYSSRFFHEVIGLAWYRLQSAAGH
jgi:uncharacterized SAM-binding protein YcdF (DUF218 family)